MLIKARPIKPTIIGENLDIGPMKDVKFTPSERVLSTWTLLPAVKIILAGAGLASPTEPIKNVCDFVPLVILIVSSGFK